MSVEVGDKPGLMAVSAGKLYVPSAYRGMQIEYTGSSLVDYHNLSQEFEISYY